MSLLSGVDVDNPIQTLDQVGVQCGEYSRSLNSPVGITLDILKVSRSNQQ